MYGALSLLLAQIATLSSLKAQTQGAAVTWGAESDFNYRYLWQGIAYSSGPVMQPEVWVSSRGLTLTIWGNEVLNNEARRGKLTEYSVGLGYSRTWSGWTVEPSYERWVNVPADADNGPNTGVAILRISHAAGPVSFFTTQNVDIQSYRGAYWGDAGVSWEKPVDRFTLASSASVGWASAGFNAAYFGPAENALDLVSADFSATLPIRTHFYMRPHFEFSRIADAQLRRSGNLLPLWNAGLAFGFSF